MARDLKSLLISTTLKDIMISPVHTVHQDDPLSKAQEIFINEGISHLPVVDTQFQLVGIISHKYLYKTVAPRKFMGTEMTPSADMILDGESYYWKEALDKYFLKNVMKKNPFSLLPTDTLAEAVTQMARKKLGCITIVDEQKKVVGLITNQEVVSFAAGKLVS